MPKYMTKKRALEIFHEEIMPDLIEKYGGDDKIAFAEAWNNFTDTLCKEGEISQRQYDTWIGPYN